MCEEIGLGKSERVHVLETLLLQRQRFNGVGRQSDPALSGKDSWAAGNPSRRRFQIWKIGFGSLNHNIVLSSLEECTSISRGIQLAEEVRILHERQVFLDGWISVELRDDITDSFTCSLIWDRNGSLAKMKGSNCVVAYISTIDGI